MTFDYSDTIDFILDWYDLNARILPWRENPKPYYVWVSEIMLQQTRVEAVKDYFQRFITALPEISALASVEEEKLLKLWEGLGYYNRVRNLQKAAKIIMEDHNGKMPADYNAIIKLPGIGAYTAGAISSIAFQLPCPAVDGNVLRVMKRIAGSFDDITKDKVKKELEQDLKEVIPVDRPGDFNQAIMDIGSMVCLPNGRPLCQQCPVSHLCKAFHNGTQMIIPVKPDKKPRKVEEKTILLIEKNNKYVLGKRPEKGLLAGLWELPAIDGKMSAMALEEYLLKAGMKNFTVEPLGEAKHIFSHIEWHMTGYHVQIQDILATAESQNYKSAATVSEYQAYIWASSQEIQNEYTLPTAFKEYRKFII